MRRMPVGGSRGSVLAEWRRVQMERRERVGTGGALAAMDGINGQSGGPYAGELAVWEANAGEASWLESTDRLVVAGGVAEQDAEADAAQHAAGNSAEQQCGQPLAIAAPSGHQSVGAEHVAGRVMHSALVVVHQDGHWSERGETACQVPYGAPEG